MSPFVETIYPDLLVQAVNERGFVKTKLRGRSMLPTLKEGYYLVIEKMVLDSLKSADIILFKRGTSLVVHRIIKVLQYASGRKFVTKGDNGLWPDDSPVVEADIIGIVKSAFVSESSSENILINNSLCANFCVIIGTIFLYFKERKERFPKSLRQALGVCSRLSSPVFKAAVYLLAKSQ